MVRQREWGLDDVELLTGDEARTRWPWLSPDVRGARFRAADGWLDVKRLTAGYATAASNAARIPGATPGGEASFVTGAEVTGVMVDAGRVRGVETSLGPTSAESVVVATGPFLARVAALAGVEVALAPTTRQKLVIPDLPAVPADAPMTIEEETAAHWRPAFRGCLALFTDASAAPTEPADPVPVRHDWAFGLLDPDSDHALARVAPFWLEAWADGAAPFHWFIQAGQYEYTPDRRPYLGPVGPEGLYLNGGYSGHGVMAGTGGSRLVIDLLTGAPNGPRTLRAGPGLCRSGARHPLDQDHRWIELNHAPPEHVSMLSPSWPTPADALPFAPPQVQRRADAVQRRALRHAVTVTGGLMAALLCLDLHEPAHRHPR